ncbi:Ig-like domain-containing protein [Corallococcus aberystwythensis]|uniref:Bacterial Ig-like domain-containing protein n=1 Tax=Corallococcus aberystwythensis TaxID=2316722 RepID=A0A3A8RFV0_9BACT|nr:Ig-like domain-containing protein [Corallococcus aberystwythensis]RKH74344.1 hypothetical protein D7W81_01960 [Corallococcus aberystwythensis]
MTTSSYRLLVGALAALCLNARATAEASPVSPAVSPHPLAAALPDTPPAAPVILTPTLGLLLSTALPFYSGTAEVGAKVTLSLDGKVIATVTADVNGHWSYAPSLLELLSDGVHTLVAVSTNVAGQTGPAASVQFSILALGPETVIVSGPAAYSAQQKARFVFASSALLVSYQCALDSNTFAACDNPRDFTGLAEGPHQLQVRSRDLFGLLTDPTPATYSWTVDTVAPVVTLVTYPPPVLTGTVAPFGFSANETPATFQCSVDGLAFQVCLANITLENLLPGTHTLQVRAVDAAGNIGIAVRHSWDMIPAAGGGTGSDGGTGTGVDGGTGGTTDPGPGTGGGQTPDDSGVIGQTPDDEMLGGGLGCGAATPAPAMWAGALLAGLVARARRRKS